MSHVSEAYTSPTGAYYYMLAPTREAHMHMHQCDWCMLLHAGINT